MEVLQALNPVFEPCCTLFHRVLSICYKLELHRELINLVVATVPTVANRRELVISRVQRLLRISRVVVMMMRLHSGSLVEVCVFICHRVHTVSLVVRMVRLGHEIKRHFYL